MPRQQRCVHVPATKSRSIQEITGKDSTERGDDREIDVVSLELLGDRAVSHLHRLHQADAPRLCELFDRRRFELLSPSLRLVRLADHAHDLIVAAIEECFENVSCKLGGAEERQP